MKKPTYIQNPEMYDVFYNHVGEYCIVGPAFDSPPIKLVIGCENSQYDFEVFICPRKHTNVYKCKHEKFYNKVSLIVGNTTITDVTVNRYMSFSDKIIMSTLVRNEDSYIRQWIEYHRLLGVEGFIIYDNSGYTGHEPKLSPETSSDLETVLVDYISCGLVELIDWPYRYRRKHGNNKEHNSAQTSQQCHSIHMFQDSMLVGCLDIDEYVNVSNSNWIGLREFFVNYMKSENLELSKVSGFVLRSKSFINKNRQPDSGYEFMRVYDCSEVHKVRRRKTFVNPKNVRIFATHDVINPVDRTRKRKIISGDHIYINHYMSNNKKNFGLSRRHLKRFDRPVQTDDTIMFMYDKLRDCGK